MPDLDLELKLNITTRRPKDAPEEYAAIVPDLAILVRGSGDEDAMLRDVREEVDFLLTDMSKDSAEDLFRFLINRGVSFRCEPVREAENGEAPTPLSDPTAARPPDALSNLRTKTQNMTTQRFRVPASA